MIRRRFGKRTITRSFFSEQKIFLKNFASGDVQKIVPVPVRRACIVTLRTKVYREGNDGSPPWNETQKKPKVDSGTIDRREVTRSRSLDCRTKLYPYRFSRSAVCFLARGLFWFRTERNIPVRRRSIQVWEVDATPIFFLPRSAFLFFFIFRRFRDFGTAGFVLRTNEDRSLRWISSLVNCNFSLNFFLFFFRSARIATENGQAI